MQASARGHDAGKVFKRLFFSLRLKEKGEIILKSADSLRNYSYKELIQGILKEKTEVEGELMVRTKWQREDRGNLD